MKHKAPAVHQAIEVLELLMRSDPLTLGAIAEQTGFPKATILRLLETMSAHAWVSRSADGKTYEPLIVVRRKNDISRNLEDAIQAELDALCAETGMTAEWYLLSQDYAEIVQRSEPVDRVVSVRAQLGFRRHFRGELDAVNRIVFASGVADCRENEPDDGFAVYRSGAYVHVPIQEALGTVQQHDDLLTFDREWNSNGIRRHATGVHSAQGGIAGIVALAVPFTPNADAEVDKINFHLRNTRTKIENIISGN
jgi:DNA-binding MarR family transcriptional regulator